MFHKYFSTCAAGCDQNEPCKENEYTFQRTKQFPYLGLTMTDQNIEDNETQQSLNSANRYFLACSKLLQSKLLSHSTKITIYIKDSNKTNLIVQRRRVYNESKGKKRVR